MYTQRGSPITTGKRRRRNLSANIGWQVDETWDQLKDWYGSTSTKDRWEYAAVTAAVILGGAAAGSATGVYATSLGDVLWKGVTTVTDVFYKPGTATTTAEYSATGSVAVPTIGAPTGILPSAVGVGVEGSGYIGSGISAVGKTVFGYGEPGLGMLGQIGTGALKLFTGGTGSTPSGSGNGTGTTPTQAGVGQPSSVVETVVKTVVDALLPTKPPPASTKPPGTVESAILGPGTFDTTTPIIAGVNNADLAIVGGGIGLVAYLLLKPKGRGK